MRVLLIEYQPLLCDAFKDVLSELNGGAKITVVTNLEELEAELERERRYNIVVYDTFIDGRNRCDLIGEIVAKMPNSPVAVYCTSATPEHVMQARRKGAQGFIPKSSPRGVLVNALRLIEAGGDYFPAAAIGYQPNENGERLSPRQVRILEALAQGWSNQEIAAELSVSVATIKGEMQKIIKILDARNRTDAVTRAANKGYLDLSALS